MIFVTGDTHIPIDVSKLGSRFFTAQRNLTKQDYVIICGDFGGVWRGNRKDNYWLNWFENKRFTTLFVDGNHENFPALAAYDTCEWHGGMVQFLRPSVIHLMRGYVFEIDQMTIFAMGGARSHDRFLRKEGRSWWPEEMPSFEEIRRARQNLALRDNQVDFMITHDAPQSIARTIDFAKSEDDELMPFFDELRCTVGYRHWYFGHFHVDREVDETHTAVFNRIIPIQK